MTRKMRCWYKWDKRQIITRKMDIEKVSWRKIVGSQSESRSMQSISLTRGWKASLNLDSNLLRPRNPEPLLNLFSLFLLWLSSPHLHSWELGARSHLGTE